MKMMFDELKQSGKKITAEDIVGECCFFTNVKSVDCISLIEEVTRMGEM